MSFGSRRRIARVACALFAVATLSAALAGGGCGRGGVPGVRRKIVVLGIDGMEWRLIDPLLEEGKLPNFAKLIDRGVRADLRSLDTVLKSPTIWTTIATGKGPQKHGITDFLKGTDEAPVFNSTGWRARPVWDILGEKGYTVGVINWMVSWPAQPVNGYNVTDHIVFTPEDGFERIEKVTYPEELIVELEPYTRSAAGTSDDEIAFLINGDQWRTRSVPSVAGGVRQLKIIYANDQTVANVAKHLLESRAQPDFFAVYLNGVDVCSHFYWGPMDPSSVDIIMDDELVEAFSDVIPRYYQRMDAIIGEILELIDDDSTVILCSDHGFRGPLRTPQGLKLGIWMHGPVGVLVAAGPGIAPGVTVPDASVFDITPTVLALFGEPVGRDMDGYVLSAMLDREFLARNPVSYVDTYEEPGGHEQGEPVESPFDEEIKERLRSLGYIE